MGKVDSAPSRLLFGKCLSSEIMVTFDESCRFAGSVRFAPLLNRPLSKDIDEILGCLGLCSCGLDFPKESDGQWSFLSLFLLVGYRRIEKPPEGYLLRRSPDLVSCKGVRIVFYHIPCLVAYFFRPSDISPYCIILFIAQLRILVLRTTRFWPCSQTEGGFR